MNKIDAAKSLIKLALEEDIGTQNGGEDITSAAIIEKSIQASAKIIAKEPLVVCGNFIPELVLNEFGLSHHRAIQRGKITSAAITSNSKNVVKTNFSDGEEVSKGEVICEIQGSFYDLITTERVVLNFFQRLSGVATQTKKLVRLINNPKITLLDTRKTTPGWRVLEKYAVQTGGGGNHRMGLFDRYLIKNNHIDFLGGDVVSSIKLCKQHQAQSMQSQPRLIEVEVRNFTELESALRESPEIIMLDNFSVSDIPKASKLIKQQHPEIKIEVSGNVTEANLASYSQLDIDFISMGALTHSVRSVDISMRIERI